MNCRASAGAVLCAQGCRYARRMLFGLIVALALRPALLCAAPTGPAPIQYRQWGSPAYSVPYEFDSWDALVAARMSVVVAMQSPFAYPKYVAHPGENCDDNNDVTGLTAPDNGRICSEAKTSYACTIPGVDPPYYWSYCQPGGAVNFCPQGYDGTPCVLNGNFAVEKECQTC